MAQTVVFMVLLTLTVDLSMFYFFVTRTGHEVLESPCEVSQ